MIAVLDERELTQKPDHVHLSAERYIKMMTILREERLDVDVEKMECLGSLHNNIMQTLLRTNCSDEPNYFKDWGVTR